MEKGRIWVGPNAKVPQIQINRVIAICLPMSKIRSKIIILPKVEAKYVIEG